MHRLEEIEYNDGEFILELDENGLPLSFTPAKSQGDRSDLPHWQCDCGYAFASFEEAKAHVELYNPDRPSSGK